MPASTRDRGARTESGFRRRPRLRPAPGGSREHLLPDPLEDLADVRQLATDVGARGAAGLAAGKPDRGGDELVGDAERVHELLRVWAQLATQVVHRAGGHLGPGGGDAPVLLEPGALALELAQRVQTAEPVEDGAKLIVLGS